MPDAIDGRRRWYALALLCVSFFMVVLDSTIVYTAVPSIDSSLGFAPGGVQWVITAYVVVYGGLLLFWGRVADVVGRRRMFMAGVGLFAVTSLICGLAWSGEVLIVARGIQGLAGAIMTPTGLSILMATFPEGAERNKALGVWGALAGIGATAGLLIGGPITFWLGWEWIFFINVPLGLVALVLCRRLLRESRDEERGRGFDLAGAVTITTALLVLVYVILQAPQAGWASGWTLGGSAASAALIVVFVVIEARAAAPLVPLRIFRSRMLVGGNLVILAAGIAVDGLLIAFTLYTQQVLAYSALQFGLAMSVMTLSSFVGVAVGQHLVTKFGARSVAATGMALIGVACLVLTQVSVDSGFFGIIFAGQMIFGPGMGAAFVTGQIAALSGVSDEDAGLASGIEETSFSIGGALGVALISAVALSRTNELLDDGTLPLLAQTEGYRLAFAVAAGIALLGMVAALTLLGKPRTPIPKPTDVASQS